jgi:hypothetical protein
MKTLFVDVMLNGRFLFTLVYKYCPAFRLSLEDIAAKVIEKRPSLRNKPFEMFID